MDLARYKAAVLHTAVQGRLAPQNSEDRPAAFLLEILGVPEVRGSFKLANGWSSARLGDLAAVGSGATPKKDRKDYYEGGSIPWVTSGMLNDEYVRAPTALITEKALKETAVKLWPAGTLLVAMYGEGRTRGKCSELLIEAATNQACAALVFDGSATVLQPWVKLYLTASYEANRRQASGGVQPNLSLTFMKNLLVPLPPVDEQRRILAEVSRLLSLAAEASREVTASHRRSKTLEERVLATAFTGQLVWEEAQLPV